MPTAFVDGPADGDHGTASFQAAVEARADAPSSCGIAVCAADRTQIEVEVHCGLSRTPVEHRLHVWSIEREVEGPPQANDYDGTAGHRYFGRGDPIEDFVHRDVVRAAIAGSIEEGEAIAPADALVRRSYAMGPGVCTDTDCEVLIFVVQRPPGGTLSDEWVTESVRVPFGGVVPWPAP